MTSSLQSHTPQHRYTGGQDFTWESGGTHIQLDLFLIHVIYFQLLPNELPQTQWFNITHTGCLPVSVGRDQVGSAGSSGATLKARLGLT